jgi:hypothetical protein
MMENVALLNYVFQTKVEFFECHLNGSLDDGRDKDE